MKRKLTKILLWIAAAFFLFEAILHGFGLNLLEHDKIFLPTHDRYIALFALTYATLLLLISTNLKKYDTLFKLIMAGLLLAILNATLISYTGGYKAFSTVNLDRELRHIGIAAYIWYPLTLIAYRLEKN